MNPIGILKKVFSIRKAAPKVSLEFLFTNPKGTRLAFDLSSAEMKEDSISLEMALSISAVCGRRTERLRKSLLPLQKRLDLLAKKKGYSCSFDDVFVEVLAFHLFSVMQDYWKKEECLDDLNDKDDEYYEIEEKLREENDFHNAIKYARLIADVYIGSFSCVPLPDEFLKRRISIYSDSLLHKRNVFEEFAGYVVDRICSADPNLFSFDRGLLSSVCIAFILDCNLTKFVATCKDMYRWVPHS